MKVYVYRRVKFSVDGDPVFGCHCGKGGYLCKGLFILKKSKGNFLELRCVNSLGVHIFVCPEFLSCVTVLDFLVKILVSDGTDDLEGVQ